jgi:hypothetical protein
MPFVEFEHKSYGQMTTTPEHWIECYLFDASDKDGDVWPVYKEDCKDPKYIEE